MLLPLALPLVSMPVHSARPSVHDSKKKGLLFSGSGWPTALTMHMSVALCVDQCFPPTYSSWGMKSTLFVLGLF